MSNTTTVLTIDLPGDLGDRIRRALADQPGRSVRDITLEALDEWLNRRGIREAPGLAQRITAVGEPLAGSSVRD